VLRENALPDAALRMTLTRGPAARGVVPVGDGRPTVLISAGPLPGALPPAKVVVADRVRRNEFSPLAGIKSLNYLDNILARQEAAARGADDALLLSTQGFLAEASAANVFVKVGGSWVTPPVSDGALPGVMRGIILERLPAREKRILSDELYQADAAFLSNSLGYRLITHINTIPINTIPEAAALELDDLI
jgi:branched-chain amino acid aminotransferase